ncbi:MAG: isoprenylcysteine carboxylmethyltransferase family protein [Bacteroidetes bacterium]|nr:isoprenylcysteine carboxylmethyltransferase family protein [Bacteroidota bacterium]
MLHYVINGFLLLFVGTELLLMFLKKSKSSEVKFEKDKSSMTLLWIVIVISIVGGNIAARNFQYQNYLVNIIYAGMGILLFGMIFRLIAIYHLGKEFTVDVVIGKNHVLHDTGMYKYLRHPSYLGLLLEFGGMSMLFNSWVAIPVIVIPILIGLMYRMKIEEEALCESLGDPYRNYMKRTKRIIPGIY